MDNTTRIINGKEYVKYPYKYVTSKYSIFTEKDADYAYKLIRFAGSDAEEDLTDQIGNNVFRDIILELLELRRALDAAEAQLTETTTPKSTRGRGMYVISAKYKCSDEIYYLCVDGSGKLFWSLTAINACSFETIKEARDIYDLSKDFILDPLIDKSTLRILKQEYVEVGKLEED